MTQQISSLPLRHRTEQLITGVAYATPTIVPKPGIPIQTIVAAHCQQLSDSDLKPENYFEILEDSQEAIVKVGVSYRGYMGERLPVKYRNVIGAFDCAYSHLVTLKGLPKIAGSLNLDNCLYLRTIEDISPNITGTLIVRGINGMFIPQLHKYVKQVRSIDYGSYNGPMLNVFNFKGLESIYHTNNRVTSIINTHLNKERDFLLCQDELIDAGLNHYAKFK